MMKRRMSMMLAAAWLAGAAGAAVAASPAAGRGAALRGSTVSTETVLARTVRAARVQAPGTAAANQALARASVARVLGAIVLPAGATAVSRDPETGSWLSDPSSGEPDFVHVARVYRYWRVPGGAHALIERFTAHPPAGMTVTGTSAAGIPGTWQEWTVQWTLRHPRSGVFQEGVVLSAAAARGGGSALLADSWAVWRIPRPRWERIPAGVAAVALYGDMVGGKAYAIGTITDARTVRTLVGLLDGLQLEQPTYGTGCPATEGPLFDLRFTTAYGLAPVATAVVDGCGGLRFTVAGRRGPELAQTTDIASLLWRLGALPPCPVAQLRGSATTPATYPSSTGLDLELSFRYVGSSVCGLEGYPAVTLLDGTGSALPTLEAKLPYTTVLTVLAPQMSAVSTLVWRPSGAICQGPGASAIRVTLPGQASALVIAVGSAAHPVAPCGGVLGVEAITPAGY